MLRRMDAAQALADLTEISSQVEQVAIVDADGSLLFTETVRGANHAINRLDPLVAIELITGSTARGQRKSILGDLRARRLDAIAAPRVLDEGIDATNRAHSRRS